jgi:hypothetical protein
MNEDPGKQPPRKETTEEREKRLERERGELLARVAASEISTMRNRIAWLMNRFPDTRNSDVVLQIRHWEVFESDIFNGRSVQVDDLYKLTRLTSVARERARIQNQYRLFLADPAVQERRGTLEEDEREKAVKTPDYPVYTVYLDESGKTSPHLIVGSLWFLSSGMESLDLYRESQRLKEVRKFDGEFHFA